MKKFSLPLSVLALLLAAAAGASLPGSGAIALNWFAEGACDDALAQNPGELAPCRYDAREADCGDALDDDSDEATDCLDSDCAGAPGCAVAPRCPATELDRDGNCDQDTRGPLYGEPDLCADGYDGDGDGFTDGCDVDCAPGAGGHCPAEDCQAYGDEDGDAVWDGCDMDCAPGDGQDRGCAGGEQTAGSRTTARGGGAGTCVPSAEVCGDRIDQDCDGLDAACGCPWWNPWCDVASVCGDGRCDSGESCPVDCATRPAAEACDNGNDDDGDGFADCGDPDCALEAWCQGPSENCNDGGDNDGDGWADCWDSGCTNRYCATFGGLGKIGWPTDPSHPGGDPRNPTDPNNPGSGNPKGRDPQGNPLGDPDSDGVECGDNLCDKNAGECSTCVEDCPVDACKTEIGACSNGQDDDGDRSVDCDDGDCINDPYCTEDGNCANDRDDDSDGQVDCDDEDCKFDVACGGEGCIEINDDGGNCFDGHDNDRDGLTDCADLSCDRCMFGTTNGKTFNLASSFPISVEDMRELFSVRACGDVAFGGTGWTGLQHTVTFYGIVPEQCEDGFDNDRDGLTDAADIEDCDCPTGGGGGWDPRCDDYATETDCSATSGDEDFDGLLNCADLEDCELAYECLPCPSGQCFVLPNESRECLDGNVDRIFDCVGYEPEIPAGTDENYPNGRAARYGVWTRR